VGYWPPSAASALALLAAQTVVLLSLAVLLSTAVSPMASGVVAVGLFGATWVAGVVGGLGTSLGNEGIARIGTVSRVLLPTDGLWRGAMHAFQDPSAFLQFGGGSDAQAFPFLSAAPLAPGYLVWAALWVAMVWGLAAASSCARTCEPRLADARSEHRGRAEQSRSGRPSRVLAQHRADGGGVLVALRSEATMTQA